MCANHCLARPVAELASQLSKFTYLKELYIEFENDVADHNPGSDFVTEIRLSQVAGYPGSWVEQYRQEFATKMQELVEERQKLGGSELYEMELVVRK